MIQRILLLSVLLLIVGCGSSSSQSGDIIINKSHSSLIVGEWAFVYPATGCVETYIFNNDRTWVESSLDERQKGSYFVFDNIKKGKLSLNVENDNGLSDCLGASIITDGEYEFYIDFENDYKIMNWYLEQAAATPFISFNKK